MIQDLKYTLRTLAKSPGFTATAIIALGLGIGANSAVFSVVNAVLLRPLPYPDPDRILQLWEANQQSGVDDQAVAAPNYLDWHNRSTSFAAMAGVRNIDLALRTRDDTVRIPALRASAEFFTVLGVQPFLGRPFTNEEDRTRSRVSVLSHGLWQRTFGADRTIVGRPIVLNGESYTVIGVMPASLDGDGAAELWVPMSFAQDELDRGRHFMDVMGRLKPGISLQAARAEMDTIGRQLAAAYPDSNRNLGVTLVRLRDEVVGDFQSSLLVLLGAVGFVLLIACANVANLLLARSAGRSREIAVRQALGASRVRLLRQLLTESITLAALGGALGLLLAAWTPGIVTRIGTNLPRIQSIRVDWQVFLFTTVISLATGLVFGLAPAWRTAQAERSGALRESTRGAAGNVRGTRLRGALVAAEVALSLVLLAGAGLLMKSLFLLTEVSPGFRRQGLLTMRIGLSPIRCSNPAAQSGFYHQLLLHLARLPGVESAAIVTRLPFAGGNSGSSFTIPEKQADRTTDWKADYRAASPAYFRTMGIPLHKGRVFEDRDDRDGAPRTIIINQTWRGACGPTRTRSANT